jgi:hypothetical protein
VSALGFNSTNLVVCQGGAFSGETCGLQIFSTTSEFVNVGGQIIGPGWWARKTDNTAGGGEGDSGGPMYRYATSSTVRAQGITTVQSVAPEHLRSCQGVQFVGRRYSVFQFFVDLSNLLPRRNLRLVTIS